MTTKTGILFILTGLFLAACSESDTSMSVLVLKNGRYYLEKEKFEGKAYSYYENGKPEGVFTFDDGMVKTVESLGYLGELINTTEYILIADEHRLESFKHVYRILLVKSAEGTYEYNSLLVIVSTELFQKKQLMQQLKNKLLENPYVKDRQIENISFALGELEERNPTL